MGGNEQIGANSSIIGNNVLLIHLINKIRKLDKTTGMYGDLSGLVLLPQIKKLELGEGEK